MLNLENVEVVYNGVILVLKGVSLKAEDGKITALLGANGVGKTTTLKSISGLLKTELGEVVRGSIHFDGHRLDKLGATQIAKLGIIQVLEGRPAFEHLTVEENIRSGAYSSRESSSKDLEMVYGYFPALKELRKRTAGYLSGGERQMLVIGRALMAHPKLMMLDEPSLGLAPLIVKELFDIVRRINAEQGTSILLVEQNAEAALGLASYGYVMEGGKVVLDGEAEKLRENPDIKEFYMGLSAVGEKKSFRDVKHYKRRKRWL